MANPTVRFFLMLVIILFQVSYATEFPTSMPTNAISEVVTFSVSLVVYNVPVNEFTPTVKANFKDTVSTFMDGVRSADVDIDTLSLYNASAVRFLRNRFLAITEPDTLISWTASYSSQALLYPNVSSSIEDMTDKLEKSINQGTFRGTFNLLSGLSASTVELAPDTSIDVSYVMDHSPPPTSQPTVTPEPPFEFSPLQIALIVIGVLIVWMSCGMICANYYSMNLRSTEHTVRRPYKRVIRSGAPVGGTGSPSVTRRGLNVREAPGTKSTPKDSVVTEEGVELEMPPTQKWTDAPAPQTVGMRADATDSEPDGTPVRAPAFPETQPAYGAQPYLETPAPEPDTVDPTIYGRVEVVGAELDEEEEERAILVHIMTTFVDELDALNMCPTAVKAYKLVPTVSKSTGAEGPKMAIEWPDLTATRRWTEGLIAEYRLLSFYKGNYCKALFTATSLPEHDVGAFRAENETFVNLRLTHLDPATQERAPVPAPVVIDGLLGFHGNISKLRIYGNGLVKEIEAMHANVMRYQDLLREYVQRVIDEHKGLHAGMEAEDESSEQGWGGHEEVYLAPVDSMKPPPLHESNPQAEEQMEPTPADPPSVLNGTLGSPVPTQTHIHISASGIRPRTSSESGGEVEGAFESDGEMTVSSLGTLSTVANAATKLRKKSKKAKKAREEKQAAEGGQSEGSQSPAKARPGLARLGSSTRNLHDKITAHALSPTPSAAGSSAADAAVAPKSSGRRSSLSQTLIDQEKIREKNAAEKIALAGAAARPVASTASPTISRPAGISKTGSVITPKHKRIDISTATDRWKKAVASR